MDTVNRNNKKYFSFCYLFHLHLFIKRGFLFHLFEFYGITIYLTMEPPVLSTEKIDQNESKLLLSPLNFNESKILRAHS